MRLKRKGKLMATALTKARPPSGSEESVTEFSN